MTDVLIIGDTFRCSGAAPRDPARRPRPVRLPRARRRPARLRRLDGGRPDPRRRARRDRASARGDRDRRAVRAGSRLARDPLEWAARACAHAGLDAGRGAATRSRRPSRPDAPRRRRADGRPGALRRAPARQGRSPSSRASGGRSSPPRPGWPRASRCMREAENGDGVLWLDGEPLTVERVKAAMRRVFAEHGCSAEEFIVAPGPQGAAGHEMGHGPIAFGDARRVRPLAARRRLLLLRRHDPHDRRRARLRPGAPSGTR